MFYDIAIDDVRPVTQRDIDELMAISDAYNTLRSSLSGIHAGLMGKLEKINAKHGPRR